MHLLTVVVIVLANAALAAIGASTFVPSLLRSPAVETIVSAVVTIAPPASMVLYALIRRTKATWLSAMALNTLALVGIAWVYFLALRQGPHAGGSPFAVGLSVAGAFSTLNVAYLFWRMPPAAQRV